MKNYNKSTIRNENRLHHLILLLFKKLLRKVLSLKLSQCLYNKIFKSNLN